MSDARLTTDTAPRWRGLLVTAQQVGRYSWVERRLFEILGAWSVSETEPLLKVLLDAQSHRHAWHAAALFDRLPELREVDAPGAVVAPSPAVAEWFDALAAADTTLERLVGLHRVVLPRLLEAYRDEVATRTDVADASLRRWLGRIISDVEADRAEGERVLAASTSEADDRAAATTLEAALAEGLQRAGGLRI